ncbi:MAG: hypothetical protein J6X70_02305 [Muribaculaceae bacterium]|nr:hypothetical protein [Muribaculaceae bacterium]
MKKSFFSIRKWAVRVLLLAGGMLGIVACHSEPEPVVYGPPPEESDVEKNDEGGSSSVVIIEEADTLTNEVEK